MWTATAPTGPAEVCGRIETPEVVTPMGDIGPPRIRHLGPLHIRGTPCSKSYFRPWVFPPCIAILSRGHIRAEQENGLCSIKYVTLDIMSFSAGYQKIFLI